MAINDGGPVFGGAYDEVFIDQSGEQKPFKLERRCKGMSLRDYLAAQAAVALIPYMLAEYEGDAPLEKAASDAYAMADAMLKAREKEQ